MRKLARKGPQLLKRPNGTTTPIKDCQQENRSVDNNQVDDGQKTPSMDMKKDRDYPPTPLMSPPPVPSEETQSSAEIEPFASPELPSFGDISNASTVSSSEVVEDKPKPSKKELVKMISKSKQVEKSSVSSSEEKPKLALFKKIVAFVDTSIDESSIDASHAIEEKLEKLGAKVLKKWSSSATHLIWKDGKNKKILSKAFNNGDPIVSIVSPLWVHKCMTDAKYISEENFLVSIDPTSLSSKKRKSDEEPKKQKKVSDSENQCSMLKPSGKKKKSSIGKPKEDPESSSDPELYEDEENLNDSEEEHSLSKKISRKSSDFKTIGITGSEHCKDVLVNGIRSLDECELVSSLEDAPSHLILGSPKRSLRLVFAIARGSWILDPSWIFTAVETKKFSPEEQFETKYFAGARRSRKDHQRENFKGLLSGLSCYIADTKEANRFRLAELVILSGGKVSREIYGTDVCIADDFTADEVKAVEEEYRAKFPHIVRPEWLFETIANYELADYKKFYVDYSNSLNRCPIESQIL